MRFASQLSWTPYIYSTIIQYLNYGKTRYLTSMILDTDNHTYDLPYYKVTYTTMDDFASWYKERGSLPRLI